MTNVQSNLCNLIYYNIVYHFIYDKVRSSIFVVIIEEVFRQIFKNWDFVCKVFRTFFVYVSQCWNGQ